MPKTIGHAVGYIIGAVVMFTIGYAIVTRIPPLWRLLNRTAA